MFLESSTDTLISIDEEKIALAKLQESNSTNEDPRVFNRCPKNIGMIGMVMKENKLFHSNYYIEAMDHDSDVCKAKYLESTNNPCAVI